MRHMCPGRRVFPIPVAAPKEIFLTSLPAYFVEVRGLILAISVQSWETPVCHCVSATSLLLLNQLLGGILMNKIVASFAFTVAVFGFGSGAMAGVNGYIWSIDASGVAACYPSNASAQIAPGSVAVPNQACQYSFAWGYSANGTIICQAIGVNGQFFVGAQPVPGTNCAKSYLLIADSTGVVGCYGQGPDGNVVPNIPAVASTYCNNW